MAPIYLTSGAYQSKSVTANAQRCVNLYLEGNPENTRPNTPTTHYQRPGKTVLGRPPIAGVGRGLYAASNGDLYAVIGSNVYFVDANWQFFAAGAITDGTNPTSMADNGQHAGNDLVLVDNTVNGYVINMTTRVLAPLVDPTGLFQGSTVVCYVQTFFLFNKPDTQNWFVSLSDSIEFNALDIAAKASYADNIVTIGVRQREPWLIGASTTEPWSLTGAADFAFEEIPSTFVPVGCVAKYSLVNADNALFWLGKTLQGGAQVFKSAGYDAKRVSTYALEQQLQKLAVVSDCVGSSYQVEGHTFVVFNFPTENLTYAYDVGTDQWAQLAWTNSDSGALDRDRALFYANAYGTVVGLDWENGTLYKIDPQIFSDDGNPIRFVRGFPHVLNEMNRTTHWRLVADIQCGTLEDPNAEMPVLLLTYSDDRGQTFSDPIEEPLGQVGEYLTSPQFNNLGMARDRVYELEWSADILSPLNGVYLEVEPCET